MMVIDFSVPFFWYITDIRIECKRLNEKIVLEFFFEDVVYQSFLKINVDSK